MASTRVDRFDPALRKRIATAAVLVAIALADVLLGGWFFAIFVMVAVLLMAEEWAVLAQPQTPRAQSLTRFITAAAPIAATVLVMEGETTLGFCALAVGMVAGAGLGAVTPGLSIHRCAFGILYIGLGAVCLVWLRNAETDGRDVVLWLLLIIWATDVGAYFAGRTIGGPKLMPTVSPSKTWAGLGGGVVLAGLMGGAVAAITGHSFEAGMVAAAVLAVLAQAGDLFESALKRRAGVKDSGRLLPGHGGVLDRVDGLLFATPFFALAYAVYLGLWLT